MNARPPVRLMALMAALLFWGLACAFAAGAGAGPRTAVLHCENAPLPASRIAGMRRAEERAAEPAAFTAWRQEDAQTLEAPAFGREARGISALSLRGDARLLFPDAAGLMADDSTGCLLDRETAYALFGDAGAVGAKLRWRERDYTVRGILAAPAGTLVARAREEDALDRFTLDVSGVADPRALADTFAMRQGLSPVLAVQNGGLSAAASVCARLMPLAAALLLLGDLLLRAGQYRAEPVYATLCVLAGIAACLLLLWLAGLRLSIPVSLIPTRWSDFEFWKRLFDERGAELTELFRMKKERPDVLLWSVSGKAAACGLAALALLCGPVRRIRAQKPLELGLILACCVAGSFFAVLAAARAGYAPVQSRGLWLVLPYSFAVRYLLHLHPPPGGWDENTF